MTPTAELPNQGEADLPDDALEELYDLMVDDLSQPKPVVPVEQADEEAA